jgi:hypothetical protein
MEGQRIRFETNIDELVDANERYWKRAKVGQLLFDWQELTVLEDSGEAVEFHFRGGFVMARNRAFPAPAHRVAFLEAARRLAATTERARQADY